MDDKSLESRLIAQPSYRLGEPVTVSLEISNQGSETYRLLTWGTPFAARPLNFLEVSWEGTELGYDGAFVKRGDPTAESYFTLAPGQSETSEPVDISRLYPIMQTGEYTATLRATLYDAYSVADASPSARARGEHESHTLDTPSVTFTVIAGDDALLTSGAEARLADEARSGDFLAGGPNYVGGSADQRQKVFRAHEKARDSCKSYADSVATHYAAATPNYGMYFGANGSVQGDRWRSDVVREHYEKIWRFLQSETVTYDLNGSDPGRCGPDDFASSFNGSRTVWLCSLFWSAPPVDGYDTQFGTLIHEWSHAVLGTQDYAYGTTDCRRLATNDPGKAIMNADSHEYYGENYIH